MAKRKFGLKSLFTSTKQPLAVDETKHEDINDYPSDTDSEDHFDPSAVNRPPPLPRGIEEQLRVACEVIVRNLKPSGPDLEDTRMKSDIYVADVSDQEEPTSALPPIHKRRDNGPYKPSNGQSSTNKLPVDIPPSSGNIPNSQRKTEHDHIRTILRQSNPQDAIAVEQVETPLAPAASVRHGSRLETVTDTPALPETTPATETEPTSYMTSQKQVIVANALPLKDTSISQAPKLYNTGSLPSTNLSKPTLSATTAAAADAWMKAELEKRRQLDSALAHMPLTPPESAGSTDGHEAPAGKAELHRENDTSVITPESLPREARSPAAADVEQKSSDVPTQGANMPLRKTARHKESTEIHTKSNPAPPITNQSAMNDADESHSIFANDSFDETLAQIRARVAESKIPPEPGLQRSPSTASNNRKSGTHTRSPPPPRPISARRSSLSATQFPKPKEADSRNVKTIQLTTSDGKNGFSRQNIDHVGFESLMSPAKHSDMARQMHGPSLSASGSTKRHQTGPPSAVNAARSRSNISGPTPHLAVAQKSSRDFQDPRSPPIPPVPDYARWVAPTKSMPKSPLNVSSSDTGHFISASAMKGKFPVPHQVPGDFLVYHRPTSEDFESKAGISQQNHDTAQRSMSIKSVTSIASSQARLPTRGSRDAHSQYGYSFGITPMPLHQHPGYGGQHQLSRQSSSNVLKKWLGRRKSLSFLRGAAPTTIPPVSSYTMYQVVDGTHGQDHDEDEYDDPLVCAAPVVAFGRGW